MKRITITLVSCAIVGFSFAQGGDWFGGSGGGGGSSSSGSSGTSGSRSGSGTSGGRTGSGTVSTESSTGTSGGGATTPTAPRVVPTIGTHYDDAPEAHVNSDIFMQQENPGLNEAVAVPYPFIREADIKFHRRIWRRIDTRQKLNKAFTWPKNPITQILYELATKGKVKAYTSDSLINYMTPEAAYEAGSQEVTIMVPNPANPDDPDDLIPQTIFDPFKWEKILKFEIMEEWFFDYKYGEMRPRILAIAPIRTVQVNGMSLEVPLFWLKMDDLRPTLAKCEVYNRYNDAMRISWDDLFNHYRVFDSYIVKQTDWDDRYIQQKPEFATDGVATLLEGERIQYDLFYFEHDLWEY